MSGISELGVVLQTGCREMVQVGREFTTAVLTLSQGVLAMASSMSNLASAIRESVSDAADLYLVDEDYEETPCERAARAQAAAQGQDLPEGAIPVQQVREGCCRDAQQSGAGKQEAQA